MKTFWLLASTLLFSFHAHAASAKPCLVVGLGGTNFSVCTFDSSKVTVQTAWKKSDGSPYGSFAPLAAEFKKRKVPLLFATSGGPFHFDLTPTGLYVENSKMLVPIVSPSAEGIGSFYEKPNGVFFVETAQPKILTTEKYLAIHPAADFATQSGPMLIVDGEVNAKLLEVTAPQRKRTAVCIKAKKPDLLFALSEAAVTLQSFANLLKSEECQQALMLDTSTSSFYVPSMKRADLWVPIGPIITIVEKSHR